MHLESSLIELKRSPIELKSSLIELENFPLELGSSLLELELSNWIGELSNLT